jgi:hypothetical protein
MLSFYTDNLKQKIEPDESMDWKPLTKHPLATSQIGRWKKMYDDNTIKQLNEEAGELLKKYNYMVVLHINKDNRGLDIKK